jgi:Mg/Co/Ni transporter MgtE
VFLPITRVTSVAPGAVITTGLINVRRFERRIGETLVLEDLLDRRVQLREGRSTPAQPEDVTVFDIGLAPSRPREWEVAKVAVQRGAGRLRRRGETRIVDWDQVDGLEPSAQVQGVATLLTAFAAMRAADLAEVLVGMSPKRRREVVTALDDERLADVLEELDHTDQRDILAALDEERAADVLEEMGPDDAADLLSELPPEQAQMLLNLMEPDEAEPVRLLMAYDDDTAGGLMTTEPVIVPPDTTIAEVLARLRNPDLTPALAAMAYVCRHPLEPPTGRFVGAAHFQRLLREAPSSLVSAAVDADLKALRPDAPLSDVTEHLANYNLVAAPVVDDAGHLLGVVSVDDVLDHLLPETWRRDRTDSEVSRGA